MREGGQATLNLIIKGDTDGSVQALADDIQRHLDGRPVVAHRDSFGYSLGKFVQRNRAAKEATLAELRAVGVTRLSVGPGLLRASLTAMKHAGRAVEDRELARAKVLDGMCWTMPVLADGRIYCRNSKGHLVCLDVSPR